MESTGEFSRREFRGSKAPYGICAYAATLILPLIVIASVGKILLEFPGKLSVGLIAWCLLAVTCIVAARRFLSRMDLEKPVVVLDANAVTFLEPRTRILSWHSISKIGFRENGQYRTVKTFIFDMENGGELEIISTWMAGISARQLFELIGTYHRKFGPPVVAIPGHDSSGWTGE